MKERVAAEELKWFLTLELDVGELGDLSPGQFKPVPFQKEAGWPTEPVGIIKKSHAPGENWTAISPPSPARSHHTEYPMPAPSFAVSVPTRNQN